VSRALQAGLAAAFASISFGMAVVVTRSVVGATDPVLLAFLRFLIASLLLSPALFVGAREKLHAKDLAAVACLGIIFFGLFQWFFNASLALIPASRGALWIATMPLLTFGLAGLLRIEPFTRPKLLGTVLTAIGIALALGDPGTLADGSSFRGDLLMFATACCGATYFVLSRPLLKRLPALQVTSISMISGTAFLGCLGAANGAIGIPDLSPSGWMAVAFLGTVPGAIGFGLWVWALRHSTPTRTAVFAALNPISATLLGALLLGEPLTTKFLLGFAIVLAGIMIANVRDPSQASSHRASS
jgi:drug/metabolite transporter (DMT)-like permease